MGGGGIFDVVRECIPWGGGSNRKDPIAPDSALGPGGLQEVGITRPEGLGVGMMVEEVREVGGGGARLWRTL